MKMIAIEGLRKNYGTVQAVTGVSLRVERGQAQFIIGPSGCGKIHSPVLHQSS